VQNMKERDIDLGMKPKLNTNVVDAWAREQFHGPMRQLLSGVEARVFQALVIHYY
jgi:hypothetical protein